MAAFPKLLISCFVLGLLANWSPTNAEELKRVQFDSNPDTPAVLSAWTPEHVGMWLADQGFNQNVVDYFASNAVDGEMLLVMASEISASSGSDGDSTGSSLMESLELSALQKKRLSIKLWNLRQLVLDSTHAVDFWDFRATHRKLVHVQGSWLLTMPRFTILWWYLFDYEAKLSPVLGEGGPSSGFWFGFLFAPHAVVGSLAWQFFDTNPYFTIILEAICLLSVCSDLVQLAQSLLFSSLGVPVVKQQSWMSSSFTTAFFLTIYQLLWPFIPWFLADLFFYLSLLYGLIGALGMWNSLVASCKATDEVGKMLDSMLKD